MSLLTFKFNLYNKGSTFGYFILHPFEPKKVKKCNETYKQSAASCSNVKNSAESSSTDITNKDA